MELIFSDVMIYKKTLEEIEKAKETMSEDALAATIVFEYALRDAIKYREHQITTLDIINQLNKNTKFIIADGKRYVSIDAIDEALKALEE